MSVHGHLMHVEDYEPLIGAEAVERIQRKADALNGLHVAHVNSTYYGGGVAELLDSLTLLMDSVGIKAGWRVIQGAPDFFGITKKMHNALQGGELNMTDMKMELYEGIIHENAIRNHLDHHDIVVVHDPQPLPLITHYMRKGPWIWRCHIDLSNPHKELWNYLSSYIEQYNGVIVSIPDYRQDLRTPQVFFMPAIDPFSIKNKDMSDAEIDERLNHYEIPDDLPLVVQISRFDRWKDPLGVIQSFKKAREEFGFDATLVLLGNVATDDPEGEEVYESLLSERDERIIILSREDTSLVNALQRRAAVVLQKSLSEGFGLTVTEAMWKGQPVIGGNVGGIRYQIDDGVNGFLVNSVDEAAQRIGQLVNNPDMRREMGQKARDSVRANFLMTRLLEQYIDLFSSFETTHRLKEFPSGKAVRKS